MDIQPAVEVWGVSWKETAKAYVALTKPRIILLLLITTLAAVLIAALQRSTAAVPSLPWVLLWTMVGGAMAAGGANTLNQYLDRDIDMLMARTRRRPLPSGALTPRQVLLFGVVLSVASVVVLAALVNPLSAALALAGNLFYVFVYTMWLKRVTPQNIVIGGVAGAMPPYGGLDRRHRPNLACRYHTLRHRDLLDPAALLGSGVGQTERLCTCRRAHVAGSARG